MASRFWQIIGIFRWAIELGRFDILTEVAPLSQYHANPCTGHLEALYLIANFLSRHPMRRIMFHPGTPSLDESVFIPGDWKDFYVGIIEKDPLDMPVPLGNAVNMACFVGADHTGNKVTRRTRFQQATKYLRVKQLWL